MRPAFAFPAVGADRGDFLHPPGSRTRHASSGVAAASSQWGLQVVTAGLDSAPVRYLAAADERRAEAIHALLRNPQVDLLLAARGGFGCARLFDRLDWGLLRRRRIPVVGYQ